MDGIDGRDKGHRPRYPRPETPRWNLSTVESLSELVIAKHWQPGAGCGSGNRILEPIMKNQSCDGVPGVVTQSRVRRVAKVSLGSELEGRADSS